MTCVCQHTSMRLAPASVRSGRAACCSGRHLEREPNRTLVRTGAQIDPRTSTPSESTTKQDRKWPRGRRLPMRVMKRDLPAGTGAGVQSSP
ncbi:hypothetical protein BKA67DRAFT_585865 [Truncatella angustata]|uniref:Uncharacterized protein n=1 Tax=Truncatella angustata TaxID=152316 RepID=A0A9P8RGK4_9PEZI|nr:uncharacterized protein BKA67DRAFT_585865 [Truncatella angustata]KAH6645623.1 hypothetical protein BKA67DRAFT_585865 [Truncatella angustata]